MTKLRKLEAQWGIPDALNTRIISNTIETLPPQFSLCSEVWIYQDMKE